MGKTAQLNIIKAVLGTSGVDDTDFIARLNAIHEGLLNNPAYPTPPVSLADFKTAIDAYSAAIAAALDGGKGPITARDKCRADVSTMFHLLGHYVEVACKNDMNTFVSSGFVAAPKGQRSQPEPVAVPSFGAVQQGNSGELVVTINPVEKARHYDVRWGAVPAPGASINWNSMLVATTKPPVRFSGLSPGTTYTFQVRAFGKLGYSDWSDPVSRMSI